MRAFVLLTFLFSFSLTSGCCTRPKRTEPQHPGMVEGWNNVHDPDTGVHRLGRFVLQKGESTSNGKIKIEVIGFIPPAECESDAGSPGYKAYVVLRFTSVEDSRILLEDRFSDHSNSNTYGTLEIATVSIYNLNLKEGWVHFELRGVWNK